MNDPKLTILASTNLLQKMITGLPTDKQVTDATFLILKILESVNMLEDKVRKDSNL